MARLPVSGLDVWLRLPDGADEMALMESERGAVAAGLGLLERLATRADGVVADWRALPVTDFEVLLLRLRETLLGGEISSQVGCPHCRERVEISFRIGDYLARIRPRRPAGVSPGTQAGWFCLDGRDFRVPRVGDLLAVRDAPDPGAALAALCLDGVTAVPMRAAPRRIEAAMARLAPEVTGEVGGACPGCGALLTALFDVPAYVVTELRRLAAGVYEEVHLLAAAYGWAEAAILALPGARRRHYAGLVREHRHQAAA